MSDDGWAAARAIYRGKCHAVINERRELLSEAPNHVPVLALDLQHMLDELLELDDLRARLGVRR